MFYMVPVELDWILVCRQNSEKNTNLILAATKWEVNYGTLPSDENRVDAEMEIKAKELNVLIYCELFPDKYILCVALIHGRIKIVDY